MKTKLICGLVGLLVIFGCGGAGAPYVPDINTNNTTGGNYSITGGGSQTILRGDDATYFIQVALGQIQGRSPSPVTLSVTGLPAGTTAEFSANPVVPTDPATEVTLTVHTTNATPFGSFVLTVKGDDGTAERTTTVTLDVVDNIGT